MLNVACTTQPPLLQLFLESSSTAVTCRFWYDLRVRATGFHEPYLPSGFLGLLLSEISICGEGIENGVSVFRQA
jgi:hypothetical protein